MSAALDPAGIEELAGGIVSNRALPVLLAQLEDGAEEQPRWAVLCLLKVRANGFMVIGVNTEEMRDALTGSGIGDDGALLYECSVPVLGTRQRVLGQADALLADLPWSAAAFLIRQSALRGALLRQSVLVGFTVDGERGRAQPKGALDAALGWINSGMEDEAAQEYFTAGEEAVVPSPSHADQPPDLDGEPMEESEVLKARIHELEAQLLAARRPVQSVPTAKAFGKGEQSVLSAAEHFGKTPGLFQPGRAADLDQADLQKLQAMIGSPPPRVGKHEQRRQIPQGSMVPFQDALLSEVEKEVAEAEPVDQMLGAQTSDGAVMTQMLMTQLQQNALLLQRLVGKSADPVMGALSGPDSGSGSGGSGVKGCIAREAYCKATTDLTAVGAAIRRNALQELGMDQSREDGSVMRRYIERRIPLQEHRLLCHVATLAAEGWAQAFATQNHQMLGFLGLLLMFVEQVALDQGKVQLGWLLTGLPEPNHQVHFSHRKKPGLKPFSRLANPVWVSANLAYLRDLDFLETRMSQVGQPSTKKKGSAEVDSENENSSKPQPKRKNRKGKGKGSAAAGSTEEPAA